MVRYVLVYIQFLDTIIYHMRFFSRAFEGHYDRLTDEEISALEDEKVIEVINDPKARVRNLVKLNPDPNYCTFKPP